MRGKEKLMTKTENRILKKFETTDVTIEIINGVPMFELYSIGMALGYVKSNTVKGKLYYQCRKDRVDKTVKNAGITPLVHDGLTFLNENQLYDFMFEAYTEKCKPFRKWVVEEVLPIINHSGGYVESLTRDFMEQKLFKIKETPCKDGRYRPVTYVTHKGLEYIRKMLANHKKLYTA